jgi:hypothetical protein
MAEFNCKQGLRYQHLGLSIFTTVLLIKKVDMLRGFTYLNMLFKNIWVFLIVSTIKCSLKTIYSNATL